MSESRHDITGKHAVVTGGLKGIGLKIAIMLVQHGVRVSAVSRSGPAEGVVQTIEDRQVFVTRCDVTDEEQIVAAFRASREANGPVDILVNNSGIAESAPLMRTSTAMWNSVLATNLTGTFLCTREAAEDMMLAKWGRIVNIASTAGLGGAPYISAYCASKHGVVGFTRAIAAEFDGTGITANVVCPGYTETDMMRRAMDNISKYTGASEDAARAKLAETNPGGRIASVEEVAGGVLDLITSSRNGAAMVIPGGIIV